LLVRTAPGATLTGFSMTIGALPPPGGTAAPPAALGPGPHPWTPASPPTQTNPQPTYGGLPYADLPATVFGGLGSSFSANGSARIALVVSAPGGLAPASPPPGDVSAIDAGQLHDVLLYLEYRLGAS
jgi:hypothetical protein